jgi:hypothetical protein
MSTYFQPATIPPSTQPCPLCGAPVPKSERYPQAVCAACVELACDGQGRRLVFGNLSPLGTGFAAKCVETGELGDSPRCWIRGVECHAAEAYFGGVVVRPVAKGGS